MQSVPARHLSRSAASSPSEPPSGVRVLPTPDVDAVVRDAMARAGKWARALCVQEQDVKDLIQEAVLALVEREGEWPRAPLNWVFAAVRLRRRRLARARALAASYEPQIRSWLANRVGPFRAPDGEMEARERLVAVVWLLEQVKPGRRAVAGRRLLDPSTEEEIAADLGLSVNTVKSQWRRAKEDMQAAILRETAAKGEKAWLAGVLALVSAFWLWITGRREASARGVFACVALSVFVSGHLSLGAVEASPNLESGTALLTREAPFPGSITSPDETKRAENEPNAHKSAAAGLPPAAPRSRVASASRDERLTAAARPVPHTPEPLAKAREALRRDDLGEAAAALRLYETTHREPAADSLHRALLIELARQHFVRR